MSLIFVINGELQASKYANVQEFCMQSPRGAYTTAHIRIQKRYIYAQWMKMQLFTDISSRVHAYT